MLVPNGYMRGLQTHLTMLVCTTLFWSLDALHTNAPARLIVTTVTVCSGAFSQNSVQRATVGLPSKDRNIRSISRRTTLRGCAPCTLTCCEKPRHLQVKDSTPTSTRCKRGLTVRSCMPLMSSYSPLDVEPSMAQTPMVFSSIRKRSNFLTQVAAACLKQQQTNLFRCVKVDLQ